MNNDPDLAEVRLRKRAVLEKATTKDERPARGSGGCVPRGTLIETVTGARPVEELRIGDQVVSLSLEEVVRKVSTRITAIRVTRGERFIWLGENWMVTPSQPLRAGTQWIRAEKLKAGDKVMNGEGALVTLNEPCVVRDSADVFDLSIDEPCHNYIANGLLCHNKTPGDS